ncbi:probable palmitoyltransferase ZDHHC20 isoform X1 [Sinocyclocheilus rhinocerous]|uniref:probable palmitoyltransferase ZDHHC20 isoform X1 n=1 Tax=Sinocyclocheilus rhinocerous TaxID=307959 RepID=UPI0007BAC79C|nr:PREDICTED: probable palmitoyltransferase ZDHHC20 isoform X1 [Sinocyclocheilus rhinocerous]
MAPSHAVRCCQRGLSWIPVIFINLVVCWSYYAYVVELCIYTIANTEEQVIYLIVFHVFFFVFIWSYWKTIISKPASPSKEFCLPKADKELYEKEENSEAQQEILKRVARNLPVYTRTGSGAIRYCDRCQLIKPDRCHHCSTCDRCVLKMDHHCPWVNNCVGFSNYKFFVLFLAYSMLYCVYIAATVLQYFIKFWTLCRRRAIEHCPENHLPDTHAKFHVLFLFFVAAMFFISILSLFSYHLWLVGKNRTTIEAFRAPVFRNGPDKNGFTVGFRKNVTQVFGDQKKCWCMPLYSSLGDGYTFPTRLVNVDSEQGNVEHQAIKCTVDAQTNPRPLSESQNHLLGNDMHSEEQKDSSQANIEVCQPVSITMENES